MRRWVKDEAALQKRHGRNPKNVFLWDAHRSGGAESMQVQRLMAPGTEIVPCRTAKAWPLIVPDGGGLPRLMPMGDEGFNVKGELVQVIPSAFAYFDRYFGVSDGLHVRLVLWVEVIDRYGDPGERIEAWTWFSMYQVPGTAVLETKP